MTSPDQIWLKRGILLPKKDKPALTEIVAGELFGHLFTQPIIFFFLTIYHHVSHLLTPVQPAAVPWLLMSIRPILKRDPSTPHRNHAVHFPPSTSLTRTFVAYSSSTYDRSPIIVTPNSCALPERGCPGRTYGLDDTAPPNYHPQTGRHYHPRAFTLPPLLHDNHVSDESEIDDPQRTPTSLVPPPLIPDLSSESDESDTSATTLTDLPYHRSSLPLPDTGLSISTPIVADTRKYYSYTSYSSCRPSTPTALSFLPHPPSPPGNHQYTSSEEDFVQKPRRSRPRRRERSRDRDRIRESDHDHDDYSYTSPRSKSSSMTTARSSSMCRALSSFSIQDQDSGCLGGF